MIPAPQNYQTIAPTRSRAFSEYDQARRALIAARKEQATPERIKRLEHAYWDAGQLYGVWKEADHIAAMAGALD